MISSERTDGVGGIAIIAMAGRFPGATDLDTYWRNVRDGVESIRFFSDQELQAAGIPTDVLRQPSYVKARGILDDIELFDASFFGYSASDALMMDPQQRLFLEGAWEALERAGYDPRAYPGLVGVYAGATTSSYVSQLYQALSPTQLDGLAVSLGNDLPFLTTRVSYKLDLKGPSYPVQTACSTSLVAVHLACQGLLNSECDLAIAGGISIRMPQVSGYRYQQDGIFSPDGRCRPFDARAQGTLFSNGMGLVVLKRLEDALADRDVIHAVIKGSAINNDGSMRASFTAPGVTGQTNVITDALASAEVGADTIGYIESHGTATPLGDAIEIQALTQAFGNGSGPRQYCAIGSVKANIGHLDAAAGIAGLIKTVLALEHRQLPPAPNFELANPDIRFESTPFYVNTALAEWQPRAGAPRRAGVSAFGFGGTNAHVVLEEAPEIEPSGTSRPVQLLTVSADSEEALEQATSNLIAHLDRHPEIRLPDAAYTLNVGRRAFRHRRILVCHDVRGAARAMEQKDGRFLAAGTYDGPARPVVFRLRGTDAPALDRDLYDREAALRSSLDECAGALRRLAGLDLRDLMFSTARAQADAAGVTAFAAQYALARLWMSWGVQPAACVGADATGEEIAACLSGQRPLIDAIGRVLRQPLSTGRPSSAELPEALRRDEPIVLDLPFPITQQRDGAMDLASLLLSLGSLWLAGARIDWSAFYSGERRFRVPLPTYPFQRRRFALERPVGPRPVVQPAKAMPGGRKPSVAEWFYAPIWTQAPLSLPLAPSVPVESPGLWLMFLDTEGIGQQIGGRLEQEGHAVVTVSPGDRFARLAGRRFTIDPRSAGDYERLIEEACEGERTVTGVVHAWGVGPRGDRSDLSEYESDQDRVFGSVLLLAQALGQSGTPFPIRMSILTTGVHDVIGAEDLSPGRATVLGLRHVIAQEYPHIVCKAIDLDAPEHAAMSVAPPPTLAHVLHEVTAESSAPVVAYRGASRWIQKYAPLPLPEPTEVPARLRSRGVYLITGGLGDIGLAIAMYLARTVSARLVLTGRSALPSDAEWHAYVESHGSSDATARRIERVRAIRACGAEVLCVRADVGDREQMADAFAAAERRFGRVDGVIHAAGLMGGDTFKPIATTDRERWRRQFHPKAGGLVVLDELLRDRAPDFCLLISSLSAVLGGLGYGAYASANVFLDAVARFRIRTSRFPWLSVNWDAWLRPEDEAALRRAGAMPSGLVMSESEGIAALHRILSADVGAQIVVSTGDLAGRLDQWVGLRPFRSGTASGERATESFTALPRPKLRTAYVAPDGDLERAITEAFRQGLGLEQVGIHDNFFELGGHSLKAIEVAARLQSALGADVRVTTFYEAPTAALLARAIEARGVSGAGLEDVDRRAEDRLQRLKLRRRGTPA